MNEIANLQPTCIWRNFDALTKVPRPSGHLEKVQQFLLDFAKRVGVEGFIDEGNNVVMRKAATPGMENRKTVLLQAHMDMVPQKSPESNHNFETDPIETYIDEEGWVRAKGTTLGADDGIGVAAIMAIMEATDLQHGPVEALITADEETGMYGANDLPEGELHGDILLNLDSETWSKFVIGSAGGIDITATLDYKEVETAGSYGGWDPNPDSEILHLLKKIYKEQNGEEAVVQVDHAGLECSIILGKYPGMDVVSLGPTIRSPHTTNERCQVSTIEPFWKLLKQVLIEAPVK